MSRYVRFGLLAACWALLGAATGAGQEVGQKELQLLNKVTGAEPLQGVLKSLLDRPEDAKKAIAELQPLAKTKKDDFTYNAAFVLGLLAAEQKDLAAAETFLRVCMEKAVKLQSVRKLIQAYGTAIEVYYEAKRYEDSARLCKELIDLKTEDDSPRIVLRTTVSRFGEVDFVEDDAFDTAKRIRPNVYQTYVKALAKQGNIDLAIKLVDGLIQEQDHWLERQLKGWVLREAGKLEDAAKIYEDVVQRVGKDRNIDREDRETYVERYKYELSNMYVELKKIDQAADQLKFLISKNPDEPGYYNDLGYIWADNDQNLEEAEKLIRKALELDRERRAKRPNFDPKSDKENGAYLDSLGWLYFKQKKYGEAKEVLIKAIEDKAAQHIEIYDHLGDVHMALGEREAAIQAWERGLDAVTESRRDAERKALVEKKLEKAKGK